MLGVLNHPPYLLLKYATDIVMKTKKVVVWIDPNGKNDMMSTLCKVHRYRAKNVSFSWWIPLQTLLRQREMKQIESRKNKILPCGFRKVILAFCFKCVIFCTRLYFFDARADKKQFWAKCPPKARFDRTSQWDNAETFRSTCTDIVNSANPTPDDRNFQRLVGHEETF